MNYSEILEGLLFLAGDEGISENEIKKILNLDKIEDIVNKLSKKYETNSGLELIKYGSNYTGYYYSIFSWYGRYIG